MVSSCGLPDAGVDLMGGTCSQGPDLIISPNPKGSSTRSG
jgi:hypothetical protein